MSDPIRTVADLSAFGALRWSASASASAVVLSPLAVGAGSGGGPLTYVELPDVAAQFPGATRATVTGLLFTALGMPTAWAPGDYSAGDIVENPNPALGDGAVGYVCTTGGTDTSGPGPLGFGVNLTGGVGSPVRWRSATATLLALKSTAAVPTPTLVGSTTATYSIAGALIDGGGPQALRFTLDLTAALVGATEPILLVFGIAGDPADMVSDYTQGVASQVVLTLS